MGYAARFVTTVIVIAAITNAHKKIQLPEAITANSVTGVIKQP